MLTTIAAFFERYLQPAGGAEAPLSKGQKHLAVAALLIEVAMADHVFDEGEMQLLERQLQQKFAISDSQLHELIALARDESAQATSLHQFTTLIHQHCNSEEKFSLLVCMWELALADQELNKYEEYIIRKVADLIYVSHAEFMRAKFIAKKAEFKQ